MKENFKRYQLVVKGNDAREFLQGQLTTDIFSLSLWQWRVAAHCNPQGKVLAIFLVAHLDIGFLLVGNAEIAEQLQKRLTLFTLHKDVTIAPSDYQLMAIADNAHCVRVDGCMLQLGGLSDISADAWIVARIADVGCETQALYLPQQLGLEENEGLSYQKGCYIGQEAVARAHYKGAVNRHLHRIQGQETLTVGEKLTVEGQNVATVILAAENSALAVVQDKFVHSILLSPRGVAFRIL